MAGKQLLFYYNPEHKGSNKGVNFSSEYRFYVDYEKRDGIDTYTLRRDENWKAEDHPDIFASNPDLSAPNITGVTAIVGENGTGKTTLMTNILNTLIYYRENPELFSRDKPFILVVKNRDGKGGINRLWTAYAYDNHEIYEYTFMRDSSTIPQDCFYWITDIPISLADILPDTSLIYLTNSFYEPRKLPDNVSHIFTALTPEKTAHIANTFYDARLHYPHPEGDPDKLNCKMLVTRYSEELRRHFADDGYYQSIWDAQYYFNKYKRSKKSEEKCTHGLVDLRMGRIVMWVGFYDAYDAGYSCAEAILREAEGSLNAQTADSPEIQERHFDINDINQRKWQNEGKPEETLYAAVFRHLSYKIRGCLADHIRLNRSETTGIDFIKSQLYASLLFEWCITYGRDIPKNCNDIKSFLQSEFEYADNHRRNKIKSKFSEWAYNDYRFTNANYFLSAIEGIEKLSAFSNTVTTRSANPSNFFDYQFCFDNSNKKSFDMTIRFFEYIEWCWHYCPFILKYISIMQPGMSSGERALQNFLSWLNLLTDYSDLLGNRSIRLGKNLILLIDEMDLYLHPEWQRRFLNELITELKTHFRRFNIQIIFATHSPLCLSDVPQDNIVYLRRREAGENDRDSDSDGPPPYLVDNPENHAQTFGAPVFSLLDDAFFLRGKGTMGVFAEKYINRILQDIQILREKCQPDKTLLPEEDYQEEIRRIRDAARPIGNELLQKQIAQMLQWVREDWQYARRRGEPR